MQGADVIVVGAGFYGATIAQRCAMEGFKVTVIDRRPHVGGNSYSEIHSGTGIEIHRYGTHIFHTSNRDVWAFLKRFTEFTNYQHRVYSVSGSQVFPMPINLGTICQFFGSQFTPQQARDLIAHQSAEMQGQEPRCLEEKAISLIGRPLYEAFIKGYTEKQWQTSPLDLAASIIARLPVRYNFDNRYFNDEYEGMPVDGYTAIFDRMLQSPMIDLRLGCDFFELKSQIPPGAPVVYTGAIDRYFEYKAGALSWRTIDLDLEVLDVADHQGTAVMNYADLAIPYTRIHEYRHLHPERKYTNEKTVIAREFSRSAGKNDEPYYPVNTSTDSTIYSAYRELAKSEPYTIFGGRLGTYRYLDMHQAIAAALRDFETKLMPMVARRLASKAESAHS